MSRGEFTRRKSDRWRYVVAKATGLNEDDPGSFGETDIPYSKHLTARREVHSSLATLVYQATLVCPEQSLAVFVKQFHFRSALDQGKQLLRKSRSQKAVKADALLNQYRFVAPETLIAGWQQSYGFKSHFFTVTTALEGYQTIYQQIKIVNAQGRRAKRDFIIALATEIATLHKANFSHGDLRAGNVLCKYTNTWQFAYIDNERTKRHWRLPESARIKNLVQLALLINPDISRSDRLCFFQIYSEYCYGSLNKTLLKKVLKKTRKRMVRFLNKKNRSQSDSWL